MNTVRHLPVGISVEQLGWAWLRSEHASHGSSVIVDHEVAARLRLGRPWRSSRTTFSCGVVVRPNHLRADHVDRLWTIALVAAVETLDVRSCWPDRLMTVAGGDVGAVTIEAQLLGGRVSAAILTLRADLAQLLPAPEPADLVTLRPAVAERFVAAVCLLLDDVAVTEDEAEALSSRHEVTSGVHGCVVRAMLVPRGEVRGEVAGVDASGALILRSPTGMTERLAVDDVRDVSVLDGAGR